MDENILKIVSESIDKFKVQLLNDLQIQIKTIETPISSQILNINNIKIDKSLFDVKLHGLLDLLASDEWPEATPSFLICDDTEDDKFERAEGILDYIDENLQGKKFLDFGCGEGHVVSKASDMDVKAFGYDIVKTGNLNWEQNEKYLLTTNFDLITQNGPYDVVLLYDVLDHVQSPVDALRQVKTVCNQNTKIIVRCHSWMSRHGGHLYKQINKAWVHLFFSEEDFVKMGVKTEFLQKYYFPINTHNQWFQDAGFKVEFSDVTKSYVEPFFKKSNFFYSIDFRGEFPEWQMSQSFNDYKLSKL